MNTTKKNLLKQVSLFEGLPDNIFNSIIGAFGERRLAAGETLFHEGEPGDVFYIIKSGAIDITKKEPQTNKIIKLATRYMGDFFGEMALLEGSPRFATATAAEESELLVLSRENFRKMITENSSIAIDLMVALSSRLREADLQAIRDLQEKNRQLEETNRKLLETTRQLEKTNANIRASNKFLATIISASKFFIIVTDANNKIFVFNDAAKAVFGRTFSEVAGEGMDSILKPVGNTSLISEIENTLVKGGTWSGEVLAALNNDTKILIELVSARVFDEKGGTFASLYMGRDITEEKNVERQMIFLDRLASRGEMAGEIAHELNNYLTIVLGNLELMQMEIQANKIEKADVRIEAIRDGLDRISTFADGLMMYSGPELKKQKIDLLAFLESEMFFIKSQNRFDDIKFEFEFDPDLPAIEVDKSQLQQVLINLLNNAADALKNCSKEEKLIKVKAVSLPRDDEVLISVIDNGPGFKGDSLNRVFRQHFTTKDKGHGFGLLAVKRVVKNHGGEVWAENNPQGGAVFNIRLPKKQTKQTPETAAEVS